MNYGKIFIATEKWQSVFDITDYKNGLVYFNFGDQSCRMAVVGDMTIYHDVNGNCEPFEQAVSMKTPEIDVERKKF